MDSGSSMVGPLLSLTLGLKMIVYFPSDISSSDRHLPYCLD
jgi:hypothetical protein